MGDASKSLVSNSQAIPPGGGASLSDEEIEALLIRDNAQMPEAGIPATPVDMVQREPGRSAIGKVLVWLSVAMVLIGSLRYWLDWKI